MKKSDNIPTFKTIKERIDMVEYLSKLGYSPVSHPRPNEYWYHSPFRPGGDSTPSFKIDRTRSGVQVWYDHSNGLGGDLIDFARRFHSCEYGEILKRFRDFLSLSPAIEPINDLPAMKRKEASQKKIEKLLSRQSALFTNST